MIIADTIYYNGNIYTISNMKNVSTIAVKNKKIIDMGSFDNLKKYISTNTKQIDLQQKTVLPGLIDSHMHLLLYGENKLKVNLIGLTKEEILNKIKKESKNKASNGWIIGYGWNSENWIENNPSKDDLDNLCIDNPIMLQRIDGHMIWVNSKALEITERGVRVEVNGVEKEIQADSVVLAAGSRSYNPLQEEVEKLKIPFTVIGDAKKIALAFDAVHQGFDAGRSIE